VPRGHVLEKQKRNDLKYQEDVESAVEGDFKPGRRSSFLFQFSTDLFQNIFTFHADGGKRGSGSMAIEGDRGSWGRGKVGVDFRAEVDARIHFLKGGEGKKKK